LVQNGAAPLEAELQLLLRCGAFNFAMQHFLASMSEPQLRRLMRNIDSAILQLSQIAIDHLLPAAQLLVLRLSDLHALLEWFVCGSLENASISQGFFCCFSLHALIPLTGTRRSR
jgi:hypothetical protein